MWNFVKYIHLVMRKPANIQSPTPVAGDSILRG